MKANQILFQELQKVDILLGQRQWTESEYRLLEILKASQQAYEQRLGVNRRFVQPGAINS